MDCADCALKLEKGVSHLEGVTQCNVSFATAKMTLVYEPSVLDPGQVERRVAPWAMPWSSQAACRPRDAARAGRADRAAAGHARRSRLSRAC